MGAIWLGCDVSKDPGPEMTECAFESWEMKLSHWGRPSEELVKGTAGSIVGVLVCEKDMAPLPSYGAPFARA